MKIFNQKQIQVFFIISLISSMLGCKKFIEVDPPKTSVNKDNVYTTDNNATAVLTGIYSKMASTSLSLNLSVYPDLSADNLNLYDLNNTEASLYFKNGLLQTYPNSSTSLWNDLYSYVYYCNDAIEGLTKANSLSINVKQRLLGEAYFLRGFYYFYLVNLFGNPPLPLGTDYAVSSTLHNATKDQIYIQIVSDLKQAELLLEDRYVNGTVKIATNERVRPNRIAASALLARVYLFTKNYQLAEEESTKAIAKTEMYGLSPINEVFLKNSRESIWSLQPVTINKNSYEGYFYIYSSNGPNSENYTNLSNSLLLSFEKGDLRRIQWIGEFSKGIDKYYYPNKYKIKNGDPSTATEYTIVLRLAEQYLIRAESRIQQGNVSDGLDDLNLIRKRARSEPTGEIPNPLPDLIGLDKDQAISAVLQERRVEFFTEWGERWLDLKRLDIVDKTMMVETPKKGGIWKSYQSLYPIPFGELRTNPNLQQNPGYQ